LILSIVVEVPVDERAPSNAEKYRRSIASPRRSSSIVRPVEIFETGIKVIDRRPLPQAGGKIGLRWRRSVGKDGADFKWFSPTTSR
jgi:F0F1-type ATP synthase beta subunit